MPSIEPHTADGDAMTQDRCVDAARATSNRGDPEVFKCRRCGRRHAARNCPAFGRTCRRCGGKNHFAVKCNSNKQVAEVKSSEDFDILDISANRVNHLQDWVVQAQVANKVVELKVDTGAQANLLPYCMYQRLQPRMRMKPSSSVLRAYDGGIIKHLGIVTTKATIGDKSADIDFFVVKKGRQAILGLHASEALGLFQRSVSAVTACNREQVLREFPEVFTGTGRLQRPYTMVLREDSVPVVQMARRVPLSLQEPLRQELNRLLRQASSPKQRSRQTGSSPLEDGQSPGELLQGRRLRTPIPDFQDATRQLVKKHRQNMPMGTRLPPLQRG
ncbi:uncharacterized protein K02A2.6-like, partial [Dermacentor silvarum]|uniref:uncharacterized protein K02A2.6-like n=1 Tax=Dermacentor silvarum TaxID=543639 RepID=UPI0021019FE1